MGGDETKRDLEKDFVAHRDDDQSSMSSVGDQAGTKGIEAIAKTWATWSLIAAYAGIFLVATAISLEQQINIGLGFYVTSSFSSHALIATVYLVQSVVNACIKPVMAKICNVFGRLEAFSFSIFLYVLGYIQMAASDSVRTFAAAQIFYSAGFTGILITTQIFIADTSDLRWRALFSSLPDVPYLWTVWAGPEITPYFVPDWRWAYGLWAIVLPVAFLPLAAALLLNLIKAKKAGINPPRPWQGVPASKYILDICKQMDLFGLILLSAALSLILIPLTLVNGAMGRWSNASMIAMEVVGCVSLVGFIIWEATPSLSPYPFLPMRLLKNRTVVCMFIAGFFYFSVFYTSVFPFFNSYLQVVQNQSITSAGRITSIFNLSATATSIVVGLLIRYTKHYKYFIVFGSALYLTSIGLMIRYRDEGVSVSTNVGIQIAVGIGGGMFNVPAQVAAQAAVKHADVATVTALILTIIEIGGAVGAAISGNIWTGLVPSRLQEYLPPDVADQAMPIFGNITQALSYPVGSPTRIAINRAYQDGMTRILIVSVCLAAPMVILSFGVKNMNLGKIDQKVKGNVIGRAQPDGEVYDTESPKSDSRDEKKRFWRR